MRRSVKSFRIKLGLYRERIFISDDLTIISMKGCSINKDTYIEVIKEGLKEDR